MKSPLHFYLLLVYLLVPAVAPAQTDARDVPLRSDARVMCVAAHPDDDDYPALAWFRYALGCTTYDVQVTRGEGGQNEIGPELYEKLAVIRTAESRRAAERVGAVYYNLALPDFGFSKTAEETLQEWGHENALEKFVWMIRLCRPHIIITHHGLRQDHGHHQATGILLQEAFDAAADPERFPEQLSEWIEPWQATKLYIRVWDEAGDAQVPVGDVDPLSGNTYEAIGARALQEHHSQGVWPEPKQNPAPHAYRLVKAHGEVEPDAFLAGVDASATEASEFASSPLDVRITLTGDVMVCGATPGLDLPGVRIENIVTPPEVFVARGRQAQVLAERREARGEMAIPAAATCTTNLPLHEHIDEHALGAYQVFVHATANTIHNKDLLVTEDFFVNAAPPVLVEVNPGVTVAVPCRDRCRSVTVTADLTRYSTDVDSVRVELQGPPGWPNITPLRTVVFAGEGEETQRVTFTLHAAGAPEDREHPITVRVYDGSTLLGSDTGIIRVMNVTVPKDLKVGVVKSYDDTLERALEHLHVGYEFVDEADLRAGDLSRFDTICLDIRAYAKRPDLVEHNNRILDYVRNGGHVVCFYNKTFEWQPDFAPYPLRLSRQRVTREAAEIAVLEPDHALLNQPNRITSAAWEGWIQERGLYFPEDWSEEYTVLLSSHDPGEAPLEGGYLFAEAGEGSYLYTSYVWYRQLREGHTGTYKAFANMIAYPRVAAEAESHD